MRICSTRSPKAYVGLSTDTAATRSEPGSLMQKLFNRAVQATSKTTRASLCLLALFLFTFSPAIFGGKTLLLSSWDAPSILSAGAYDQGARPPLRFQRTADPGAPAWQAEPWF